MAVLSQELTATGKVFAWEVVIVQKWKDRFVPDGKGGKTFVPAAEGLPGSNAWGDKGWTLTSELAAREKALAVVERVAGRGDLELEG